MLDHASLANAPRRRSVPALWCVLVVALGPVAAHAQPETPTGVRAAAGDEEARLEWDNPQNPAIVRYEFRFGAGAVPAFNAWAAVPASDAQTVMHTVSGLVNGTRYAFEVRAAAQDAAGPAARAWTTLAVSPKSAVAVPDAKLRDNIRDALGLTGAAITQGDLAKLTGLLGPQQGVADLAGLEYAVNLDHLVLSGNEISDLSPLSGLHSLSLLDLRDNDISALSPLSALTSLAALYLADNDISDLSPLSRLTSLAALYLENNRISDIAALSSLTSLAELVLSGNDITDVSALSALTSLSELDLWGNGIADVSGLSGLTSLRSLNLSGNNISDVSPLAALASLDALYLSGNVVADIAALKTLTALSALDLSDNAVSDASTLTALTSLWVLDLSANAISDVSALSGLAALAELNLADNAISDASALSGLASLANLNLSSNSLTDVSALSGLAALQTLDLSRNAISSVSGLSGFATLRVLYLSGNDIADASGLSELTKLAVLDLSGNDLAEAPDLSRLRALSVLHLSNNQLADISALSGLESLSMLRLDGNAITKVSALRGLTLASLNLRDNAVADISPLAETEFLRAGGSEGYLDLRGNPLRPGEEEQVQALRKRIVVVFDDGGHRVPLFPSARSSTAGSAAQGFVRVINHSAEAGAISIEAVDESGERQGPMSLAIDAGQALHFNAEDLERGNAAKGLGGIGEGVGDWRLVVRSELDIEVLGYRAHARRFRHQPARPDGGGLRNEPRANLQPGQQSAPGESASAGQPDRRGGIRRDLVYRRQRQCAGWHDRRQGETNAGLGGGSAGIWRGHRKLRRHRRRHRQVAANRGCARRARDEPSTEPNGALGEHLRRYCGFLLGYARPGGRRTLPRAVVPSGVERHPRLPALGQPLVLAHDRDASRFRCRWR